jgi:cholest-4-en-3-one 26-monooxygenase
LIEVPDVSHPDTFEDGFPHAVFRELRRASPVYWHEGDYEGGRGYWIISRYETIKAISRQPLLFSSGSGTSVEDRGTDFVSMIGMDPPDHRRYRSLVTGGFTPRQIAAQESRHREIVNSILDGVTDRGHCDFVVDIAAELPLRVIAELLGVPQSACHDIFDWSNRMIGSQDPEYVVSTDEATRAAQEMYLYANGLAEDRLQNPRDDLMSAILHGEVDGSRLNLLEFDYPSANRDEGVFEDPDVFNIERQNNHHLAFGIGEHFCIGTHLARLETRVLFEEILDRMHDIELAGPVSYLRSNLIDGIKHMPLKFTAA